MWRALTVVLFFSGCGIGGGDCYECVDLLGVKLDIARSLLDDKDYKGAVEQATQILGLQRDNLEALVIRENAQSAIRQIDSSVATARKAVAGGDMAQASAAVERVLAFDPRNPIVAELSSQLNVSFSARTTVARSDMERARALAEAKAEGAQEASFAEGARLATAAARSLKDRQFTAATQTYLQARDAYDRARRAIERKERLAAGPRDAVSPTPIVDCVWRAEAQAWVDTNGNGGWDKEEEPLAGVQFRLRGYTAGVSDSQGMASLFIFPVPCSVEVDVAVSALPPPGYQPTTDQPQSVPGEGNHRKVLFGFRHVR